MFRPLFNFTAKTGINILGQSAASKPSLFKSSALFRLQAALYASGSGSKENIDKLVKNDKVVVFMKGVPEEPRCGFSNVVVQILNMHGVQFESHNVLDDEELRQGIKEYSNWPTIPQVFIKGEFVGGCDILLQMHQSGELVEELQKAGIRSALLDAPKADDEKK